MPLVLRAKTLVLGDAAVGKSALVQTFHSDGQHYPKNYGMTTGVELIVKSVTPPPPQPQSSRSRGGPLWSTAGGPGEVVELHLYDCAGQEAYQQAVESHAEMPDLCLLVYDVTSEASLDRCGWWLARMPKLLLGGGRQPPQQQQQKQQAVVPTALVAHKVDLENRRIVTPSQGMEMAQAGGMAYFEVSSKEGLNVEQPFLELARRYADLYAERCAQIAELVN